MCMGGPGCGGSSKSSGRTNSYTPKKMGGRASKGSYVPKSRGTVMSSFGKPTVRMSFGGRK